MWRIMAAREYKSASLRRFRHLCKRKKKKKILSACPLTLLCLANLFVQSCQLSVSASLLASCSSSSSTRTCVVIRSEYSASPLQPSLWLLFSVPLWLAGWLAHSLSHSLCHCLSDCCPCSRHTVHILHWRFAAIAAVAVFVFVLLVVVVVGLTRRHPFLLDVLAAAVRTTTTSRRRLGTTFDLLGALEKECTAYYYGGTLSFSPLLSHSPFLLLLRAQNILHSLSFVCSGLPAGAFFSSLFASSALVQLFFILSLSL